MSDIAQNRIDGDWRTPATIAGLRNPANGEVVGRSADGGQALADAAITVTRTSNPMRPMYPGRADDSGRR